MADLLTHYTLGYFTCRHISFKDFRVIYYLGIILPDVITRPVYILFPALHDYTVGMHTPVFLILTCLLLSEFFNQEIRKAVLKFMLMGVFVHLLLDLFQRHFIGGYYWLYPFSWHTFEIGLYWPSTPVIMAPLWILLIIGSEIFFRYHSRKA